MADTSISGLYRIIPSYPVRPVQPTDKDRESARQPPPDEDTQNDAQDDAQSDNDDKPTIDEYV